jgi:hypothetical protein
MRYARLEEARPVIWFAVLIVALVVLFIVVLLLLAEWNSVDA